MCHQTCPQAHEHLPLAYSMVWFCEHHTKTRAMGSDASSRLVSSQRYPSQPCLVEFAHSDAQQLLMLGTQT